MTTVSTQELTRDPLGVLDRVEGGESLLVTRDGSPIAELRPMPKPEIGPRPYGLAKGHFKTPDDFNDPLPDDVMRDFEGP